MAGSIQGLARITTDIVILKMVVDGPDVITWFELHTTVAAPTPVANWSRLRDGKIGRIRVTSTRASWCPPAIDAGGPSAAFQKSLDVQARQLDDSISAH